VSKGPSDVFNNTVLPSGMAPIAYMRAPEWNSEGEVTDLSSMDIVNNVFPSTPNLSVRLTVGTTELPGCFNHVVTVGSANATYEVAFSELAQDTCVDVKVPFDLAHVTDLDFVTTWSNGVFDYFIDDAVLIGADGNADLLPRPLVLAAPSSVPWRSKRRALRMPRPAEPTAASPSLTAASVTAASL
jgi:hypothetical protein